MRILCVALAVYLLGARATPKEIVVNTLDIIAGLIVAVHRNDTRATSRLLDQLEACLPLEEVIEILETIAGDVPPVLPARPLVACA